VEVVITNCCMVDRSVLEFIAGLAFGDSVPARYPLAESLRHTPACCGIDRIC